MTNQTTTLEAEAERLAMLRAVLRHRLERLGPDRRAAVVATVRAAATLLADYDNWDIGAQARDAGGNRVNAHATSARSWCAAGALERSAHNRGPYGRAVTLVGEHPDCRPSLVEVNDRGGVRTPERHAIVLAILHEVATESEAILADLSPVTDPA